MRDPTSCPWSLNSVCSVVNLNKLHIDQSEPGRTDIKVSGEALTMKGSGNLDLWTRSRAGAPVAWLDAPTDDTYTFEVNCRLVLGGGTLIFLWCQSMMVLMERIIFLSPSAPEHGRAMVLAFRIWDSKTTFEARQMKILERSLGVAQAPRCPPPGRRVRHHLSASRWQ